MLKNIVQSSTSIRPMSQGSPEKQSSRLQAQIDIDIDIDSDIDIDDIKVEKKIYYEGLALVILETEKSQIGCLQCGGKI